MKALVEAATRSSGFVRMKEHTLDQAAEACWCWIGVGSIF